MGFEYDSTILEDKHLENIELVECIELPFTKEETLSFAEFCNQNYVQDADMLLVTFLANSKKMSIIPKHDLTTIYTDSEWELIRNKI